MIALIVLAAAAAIGGRAVLLMLIRYRPEAVIGLVAIGATMIFSLRRAYRGPANLARLTITKTVLYFAALVLVLAIVLWPARWLFGTCISAIELALAFEIIVSARPPAPAQE